MIGNVWEWSMDWYERPLPGGAVTDPLGPTTGIRRVVRGGGWSNPVFDNRSAQRFGVTPEGGRLINLGFRLALAPELSPSTAGAALNANRSVLLASRAVGL